jgi:hypothetical protein
MLIDASGKSTLLVLANALGLKPRQRQEMADRLCIDSYRLSIWKQRDSMPERALIVLSILLNQKINAITGKESFVGPVIVAGSYMEIEQQLTDPKVSSRIVDNVAKAYGFNDKTHAKFIQLIRGESESVYSNVLIRGDFPVHLIIKAHLDMDLSVSEIVNGEVMCAINPNDVQLAKCLSFYDYMSLHYDGSTIKAAKANKTQQRYVSNWLNEKHLVVGDDLYVSVRGLCDSKYDARKITDSATPVNIYTLTQYIDYKHHGKAVNLARQADVTKQAVDNWHSGNKVIIDDILFSYKRSLNSL